MKTPVWLTIAVVVAVLSGFALESSGFLDRSPSPGASPLSGSAAQSVVQARHARTGLEGASVPPSSVQMQSSGAPATSRMVDIDMAGWSLSTRVLISPIIAKVHLVNVDQALMNTANGLEPLVPLETDPMLDSDDGWDIHRRVEMDVLTVYKGDPTLTKLVSQEIGGLTADGHEMIVNGSSASHLVQGVTALVFGTYFEAGLPSNSPPFIVRGFDLVDQLNQGNEVAEFLNIESACVYLGSDAFCYDDLSTYTIANLESQVATLVGP